MSIYTVDSRHDSLSETERNGRDRFPSLHLNTDFVRVWNDQMPTEDCEKLTCLEKFRVWLSRIPRKVWFIVIAVGIVGISLLTVGLILAFALPHKDMGGDYQNNVTPSTTSTAVPTTPGPAPIPYPNGYVTGTTEIFYPSGETETVYPDMRGYTFRNRLIAYGPNNTYIVVNQTSGVSLGPMEPEGCDGCALISLSDDCFDSFNCTAADAIFCCQHCGNERNVCLVDNTYFQFSGEVAQWEVSNDGEQLLLTTMYELSDDSIAFQVFRVNESGQVHNGPITPYNIPKDVQFGVVVEDPDYASTIDLLAWVAPNGTLFYEYQGTTSRVDLNINGTVLDVKTTVSGYHAYISLLQGKQFYIVRINLQNRCAAPLSHPQIYLFGGSFRGSFWGGDQFFLWYADSRGVDGISVIRYSFKWPDDDSCPYTP